MKNHILFYLSFVLLLSAFGSYGQSEDHEKLNNLKYFNSVVKDNIENMRYYSDSVSVVEILDQMEGLSTRLDGEFDKVVLSEVEIIMDTDSDGVVEIREEEWMEEQDWMQETPDMDDEGGMGVSKFIPFGKKINTKARIDVGVNLWANQNDDAGILIPEVNTGRSWYWEFGIYNQNRLGSKKSKIAINYGLSYLINRFTFSNDVRLTSQNDNPLFIEAENLTKGPKLNLGFLTVPVSFKFAASKSFAAEIGGYAGYRVHAVQKFQIRRNNEDIRELVYARHQLNNWMYGASLNLRIKGINLSAKYNFSNVFNDNDLYDYRTLMLGTSIRLL
jgi:hypothetical protein